MSSPGSVLSVRLGEQTPQILHLPPGVDSLDAAEDAIELADAYGICDGNPLAESQKITIRAAMGERADGTWAASRVADFGPRQGTGKNDKIATRELAGLIIHGERLQIHTAHEMATAKESFRRLETVFENYDDLRRKVAKFMYSNEERGLELWTPRWGTQRLIYKARSGKGARGFAKADLVVYDEAQHMAREHLAASGPAKLANPNSQTWFAGSGGLGTSAVAWAIRRDAIGGDAGRLAYTEMTAELDIRIERGRVLSTRPDPQDRDAWYRAMAGLGRWVTEESMAAQFPELGAELFARECLCVWDLELGVADSVIPGPTWDLVNRPSAAPGGAVFGVAVNVDRSAAAVAAAGAWVDPADPVPVEHPSVEVIEHRPSIGWVVGRCKALNERWDSALFAVDGSARAPVASLVPALRQAGLSVVEVTSDWPAACAETYDLIVESDLRVRRHPSMDTAVAGADRRWSGDSWVWDRRGDTDISPLEAGTAALWVARHHESATPDVGGEVDDEEFEAELARIEEDEARALAALGEDDDL